MHNLFAIQKKFNDNLYGTEVDKAKKAEITKTLSLCLHAEVSELVQSIEIRDHHIQADNIDKTKMLYESVDVFRYILAILNLNEISCDSFLNAFHDKDNYLACLDKNQSCWDGKKPVVIVDIDDVLAEFRCDFADWLCKTYNVEVDVESEEYYFITALSNIGINPEEVFENFVKDDGFRNLRLVPGAREYLCRLQEDGYWIQLLTARPGDNLRCFYDTYSWLIKNNIPFDSLDFSSEKFRWCAKSTYYDKGAIKFAIDDSPKHATEYVTHGISCFVPNKSYNKGVHDLDDIIVYDNFSSVF